MLKYSIQKYHESYYFFKYIIYVSTLKAVNDLLMNVINKSVTIFNYFEWIMFWLHGLWIAEFTGINNAVLMICSAC